MTHILNIESNETYTVPESQKETHERAIVESDGTLKSYGSLHLTGEKAETGPVADSTAIDLPMQIQSLRMVSMGTAVFIGSILAIVLAAGLLMRNYLSLMFTGMAIVVLILASMLNLSLELFWLSIVLSAAFLILGAAVRLKRITN